VGVVVGVVETTGMVDITRPLPIIFKREAKISIQQSKMTNRPLATKNIARMRLPKKTK